MQKNEFERRTGVYLTDLQYRCAEREYERQDENGRDVWPDKGAFCAAYRDNKDGLAERIQLLADEAIWRMEERHRKAMQESAERIESLARELHDRKAYCEMLEEKLRDRQQEPGAVLEETAPDIKSQMLDALLDAEHDDHTAETILHMLRGFDYLLDRRDLE